MNLTDRFNIRPIAKSWYSYEPGHTAIVANPLNNAVIYDTGQITDGFYDFVIVLTGDANHFHFRVEHRNAINTITLDVYQMSVLAFNTQTLYLESLYLNYHDRVRVVCVNAAAGNFGASIGSFNRHGSRH